MKVIVLFLLAAVAYAKNATTVRFTAQSILSDPYVAYNSPDLIATKPPHSTQAHALFLRPFSRHCD